MDKEKIIIEFQDNLIDANIIKKIEKTFRYDVNEINSFQPVIYSIKFTFWGDSPTEYDFMTEEFRDEKFEELCSELEDTEIIFKRF